MSTLPRYTETISGYEVYQYEDDRELDLLCELNTLKARAVPVAMGRSMEVNLNQRQSEIRVPMRSRRLGFPISGWLPQRTRRIRK